MPWPCFHSSHYEKIVATGEVKCIDEEIPFDIPDTWEWCRVSSLFQINPKVIADDNANAAFIPMEAISAGYGSEFRYYEKKWSEIKTGYTSFADNDIAFAKITPCFQNRKSAIFKELPNGIGAGTTELKILRTFGETMNRWFVLYFLESSYFIDEATFKGTANQQRIVVGYLENKLFPVPPLAEQERIVERIGTIMPIIDKYSNSQERLNKINAKLKESLKKSILQDAIQGKLVQQLPEEGAAQELLEQIRNEKQILIKEGRLKRSALADSVIFKGDDNKYYEKIGNETICIDEEIPFDIPHSWSWTRLGFLVSNETGLSYSKDCLSEKSSRMIRVLRGGNIEEGRWLTKDDDVMISASYVKDELILKRGTFITPAVTSIERMAKTALVEVDQSDIVVGGFVLMLKPFIKDDSLLRFLNLLFQSVYYKQYCIGITNKSGQAFYNLSRQKLMKCLIPIAPMKEMSRIAEKFASLNL